MILVRCAILVLCAYGLLGPVNAENRMIGDDVNSVLKDASILPASCDEFFFGLSFPMPNASSDGIVKLCQTQQHDGYVGPEVYATLFSTKDRIPLYSAAVLVMYPNSTGFKRPEANYWERVSAALCVINEDDIPGYPVSSRITVADENELTKCGEFQALNRDYAPNWKLLGVDRGHLNPNAINSQDQERQIATFTLTNAAPQFSEFNEVAWKEYECMTRFIISRYVPMERVYIITGTLGIARDKDNKPIWMNGGAGDGRNPVRVPGYYWKAVCYPGSPWKGTHPWSYVILAKNSKVDKESGPEMFTGTREFSNKYFRDKLFDDLCLDAPMGPIESYFQDWKKNVGNYCNKRHVGTQNSNWFRAEL